MKRRVKVKFATYRAGSRYEALAYYRGKDEQITVLEKASFEPAKQSDIHIEQLKTLAAYIDAWKVFYENFTIEEEALLPDGKEDTCHA